MEYRYTSAHSWLRETEPGTWQVGFTKFATRMLGEMVEFEFKVEPGARIDVGQVLGWTEGFKAMSDIYSVVSGEFSGANPALAGNITLIDSKPYDEGWLYQVQGVPDPGHIDVKGYIAILDVTIDKMLRSRHDEGQPHDG